MDPSLGSPPLVGSEPGTGPRDEPPSGPRPGTCLTIVTASPQQPVGGRVGNSLPPSSCAAVEEELLRSSPQPRASGATAGGDGSQGKLGLLPLPPARTPSPFHGDCREHSLRALRREMLVSQHEPGCFSLLARAPGPGGFPSLLCLPGSTQLKLLLICL